MYTLGYVTITCNSKVMCNLVKHIAGIIGKLGCY